MPLSPTVVRVVGVVFAYASVLVLVPWSPRMPQAELDPAWMEAINRAAATHLVFGRDVIFTYGPLGGVSTGMYEPALRLLTLVAAGAVALAWVAAGLICMRGLGAGWCLLLGAAVLTTFDRSSLHIVYPLAVVVATARARVQPPLLCLLGVPLGLLLIVKLSALPVVGVGVMAVVVLLSHRRRPWWAAAFVVAVAAGTAGGWMAVGQPLEALPDYFTHTREIVSGYPGAMSFGAQADVTRMAASFWLPTTLALLSLGRTCWMTRSVDDAVLWVMTIATAFTVWKACFVRLDAVHTANAIPFLVLLAALVAGVVPAGRLRLLVVVSTVVTAVGIHLASGAVVRHHDRGNVVALADTPVRLMTGQLGRNDLTARYDAAHRRIAADLELPRIDGSVDLYPTNLSELFARDLRWDPRPVIQSYSAYTPGLAKANVMHLATQAAPENLLVAIDAIDGRYPALEDGASWFEMLRHYRPDRPDAGAYVRLRHAAAARSVSFGHAITIRGELGERVTLPPLPRGASGWVASFDVTQSVVGRGWALVRASGAIHIVVQPAVGDAETYRFLPGVARASFLLSPLVRTSADFRDMFEGGASHDGRLLSWIKLQTPAHRRPLWDPEFRITLRPLMVGTSPLGTEPGGS